MQAKVFTCSLREGRATPVSLRQLRHWVWILLQAIVQRSILFTFTT